MYNKKQLNYDLLRDVYIYPRFPSNVNVVHSGVLILVIIVSANKHHIVNTNT